MKEKLNSFIAPEARILVADDDFVNQKLVTGLLEPLCVQIDTAYNGSEALEMIKDYHYNIVLMDHMMPLMDGLEATTAIRTMKEEYYQKLPIIALSGNVETEGIEKFLLAGMNDALAKPIDINKLYESIWKWLPEHLCYEASDKKHQEESECSCNNKEEKYHKLLKPLSHHLNLKDAVKNCGSEELLLEVLGDFYKLIDLKSNKIEKCLHDGLYHDYTIEIHSLRNTSRMIGASQLNKLAAVLEKAGEELSTTFAKEDYDNRFIEEEKSFIQKETAHLLNKYHSYKELLRPFAFEDDINKPLITKERMEFSMNRMLHAANTFNLEVMDEVMKYLRGFHMPESLEEDVEKLEAYVSDVDMENIICSSNKIIKKFECVW